MSNKTERCPACGSKNIQSEKRINGNTKCSCCGRNKPSMVFFDESVTAEELKKLKSKYGSFFKEICVVANNFFNTFDVSKDSIDSFSLERKNDVNFIFNKDGISISICLDDNAVSIDYISSKGVYLVKDKGYLASDIIVLSSLHFVLDNFSNLGTLLKDRLENDDGIIANAFE